MKFEAVLDAANNSGLLSLNSFWTIENCMSALAATNHDIDEHNQRTKNTRVARDACY